MRSSSHCFLAFQSTPPTQGATKLQTRLVIPQPFQSTPPTQGATKTKRPCTMFPQFQSTPPTQGATHFQIFQRRIRRFQSTPPTQGATRAIRHSGSTHGGFNPRPPRRGRHGCGITSVRGVQVSIHAPHAGGDNIPWAVNDWRRMFQSTPPTQGATRSGPSSAPSLTLFQSTPPTQGATMSRLLQKESNIVSIHAPHAGGDNSTFQSDYSKWMFQSTPPTQGATRGR